MFTSSLYDGASSLICLLHLSAFHALLATTLAIGLDELLSAGGMGLQTAALPAAMPAAPPLQQGTMPAAQSATGQFPVAQVHETPAQDMQQAAQPAVRPAPFVPNFVLNPTLEAVEEEYSSSDYSDEEI
jgi:hypothetical protein